MKAMVIRDFEGDVDEAHRRLEASGVKSKILLRVGEE